MQIKNNIPAYDEKSYKAYIELKKSQLPIFGGKELFNLEFEENREYLLSREFMDNLIELIGYDMLLDFLSSEIRNNIYELLFFIKNNLDISSPILRRERLDVINEIIVSLNSRKGSNQEDYYFKQFCFRNGIKPNKFTKMLYQDKFNFDKHSLNLSIASDYQIITGINDSIESTFLEGYAPLFLVNHNLFDTLNVLFNEHPELYRNKAFLERVEFLLKTNKELMEGTSSTYILDNPEDIDADKYERSKILLKKVKRLNKKIR